MPKNFPENAIANESTEWLRQALFGQLHHYEILSHPLSKSGAAQGLLVGGNLSLVANVAATPDDIVSDGAILFIEEVGESLYHIDRMMSNLKRSGKLSRLSALLVGYFSDIQTNDYFGGKTAYEIIDSYVNTLAIPVCYGFPAGHNEPNYALYLGRQLSLEVTATVTGLTFH